MVAFFSAFKQVSYMSFYIMVVFWHFCVIYFKDAMRLFGTGLASFSCLLHARFISCHDMLGSELNKLVNMPP